ncbi:MULTISPECIES: hypothetical protein [Bacillus]|nr:MULTISPECIES: hypothetical protein [Bacillus]
MKKTALFLIVAVAIFSVGFASGQTSEQAIEFIKTAAMGNGG